MNDEPQFESATTDGFVGAVSRTSSADVAIGEAYLSHALVLRRIAVRKFAVPEADADALVHDVFLNYFAVAHRSEPYDVRGYLVSAICNASRNYWRRRRFENRIFSDDSDEMALNEAAADTDAFRTVANVLVVASIMSRLGERCRDLLRRYYLEDQDTPSIAAAIQTTCSNVNYLMHTCRKRARAAYQSIVAKR